MAIPTPTVAPVVPGATPRGRVSWIFVETVASIAAPTAAELTAGTDYKNQITAIDGFAPSASVVDNGNAGSRVIGNVAGPVTFGDGTLTFGLSKTAGGSDARSVFKDGVDGSAATEGFLYEAPEGVVTSALMKGYAVTVTSASTSKDLDAPSTLAVVFSIQEVTDWFTVPTA